ncbi:MAG: DUF4291 domain-containing protein [Acidobacteria bacterium]|nr:DUF4291 domain-containing protein [Acidobacteriota bacterium]
MMRKIYAHYDDEGITVYQAFNPAIVEAAIAKGTFGRGFNLERMTWIKPSFGWMLYRSGYAEKHNQEAILKIKLTHEGFQEILRQSVETVYNPKLFASEAQWRTALAKSEVRHQWDPERAINGEKLERRAIQIGIKGDTVKHYVNQWILRLEDVTALAKQIALASKARRPLPSVPEETVYQVDAALQKSLGISV